MAVPGLHSLPLPAWGLWSMNKSRMKLSGSQPAMPGVELLTYYADWMEEGDTVQLAVPNWHRPFVIWDTVFPPRVKQSPQTGR